MPRKSVEREPNALRDLIRRAMRVRGIRTIDGEGGLAQLAQVSRNTIYAWEAGEYPRVGEMERVAKQLGLPTWQLVQAWERPETEEAPPAEADGAVPPIAVEVLARIIGLQDKAGIRDEELDRARARARTWLELEGTPAPRRGSGGGAKGVTGA